MACASRQNDLRSWQNDLRVIMDVRDVLGKMTCALTCALACALTCATRPGVPVAQRKSFSTLEVYSIHVYTVKRRSQERTKPHGPGRVLRPIYNSHECRNRTIDSSIFS